MGQAVVGHEGVGPDQLDELFFLDHPVAVFDQRQKRVEALGRQQNRLPVVEQFSLRQVEPEWAEGVNPERRRRHRHGSPPDSEGSHLTPSPVLRSQNFQRCFRAFQQRLRTSAGRPP